MDQSKLVSDQVTLSGVLNVGGPNSADKVKASEEASKSTQETSHKAFFHDIDHMNKIVKGSNLH